MLPAILALTMVFHSSYAVVQTPAQRKHASRSHYEALVQREARCVYDLAGFVFPSDASGTNASWVLAEVKPDASSGHYTTVVSPDAHGGMVLDFKNALPPQDEGQLVISETLTGRPLKGAVKYSWPSSTEAERPLKRVIKYSCIDDPASDLWNPFRKGGKIIIRLAGRQPLDTEPRDYTVPGSQIAEPRYYMVPDEFAPSLPSAFAYAQQHPAIFSKTGAAQNTLLLRRLLADKNPLLAVAAFKALYDAGQFSNDDVLASLKSATATERATKIKALFDDASNNSQIALTKKALGRYLVRASIADQFYGLALGLLASSDRLYGMSGSDGFKKRLKQRARSLHDTSETGEKLAAVLRLLPSS